MRARTIVVLAMVAAGTALLAILPGPAVLLIVAAMLTGAARGVFTLLQATTVTDRWGASHYGRQRHPLRARPARHRPRPLGRFRPRRCPRRVSGALRAAAGVAGCGALLAIGSVPRAAGIVDATASTQHGSSGEH